MSFIDDRQAEANQRFKDYCEKEERKLMDAALRLDNYGNRTHDENYREAASGLRDKASEFMRRASMIP